MLPCPSTDFVHQHFDSLISLIGCSLHPVLQAVAKEKMVGNDEWSFLFGGHGAAYYEQVKRWDGSAGHRNQPTPGYREARHRKH